jgi:hypothetical protein
MGPNMDINYMAIQADRKTLEYRAERGWQAKEAGIMASNNRRAAAGGMGGAMAGLVTRTRWFAGNVLVHAGVRLQGIPGIERQATSATA